MKRIKQIIEALKVVSSSPSNSIRAAWERVSTLAVAEEGHNVEAEVVLLGRIIDAVIGLAEDMEKPSKAPETN